jgi:hypothetical protein
MFVVTPSPHLYETRKGRAGRRRVYEQNQCFKNKNLFNSKLSMLEGITPNYERYG